MFYRKAVFLLIMIGALARCFLANSIELGNDEVYYWTYSQHLQWNYFDHPPLVALLIRLTTVNLTFQDSELFLRLGSITCSGFAAFFLYKTVSTIESERAGFFAALLYNASFYGSIITGVFILPDSPQMFFWTAALYMLSKIWMSGRPPLVQWILFGLLTGLAIMSKVHGLFIWVGLLGYIIFFKRKWLGSASVYISLLVTILICSPVVVWNFANHFITYRYHSSRLEGIHFSAANFIRELFGELIYNNPINVITGFVALWWLSKRKNIAGGYLKLLCFIALPMIGVLIVISMFNDTLPHWTGPAYVTLIPVTAVYLSRVSLQKRIPRIVIAALTFMVLVVLIAIGVVHYYPGTMGNKKDLSFLGKGDVTLDMYGWRKAGLIVDSIIQKDEANGIIGKDALFVCNKWYPAAHIDYYIARPLHKFVVGLGEMNRLHHYEWLNTDRLKNRSMTDALCLVPSNYPVDIEKLYGGCFRSVDSLARFPEYRAGKICRYFILYRMKHFTGNVPEQ